MSVVRWVGLGAFAVTAFAHGGAAAAFAAPCMVVEDDEELGDETHPRSPSTPLTIEFTPIRVVRPGEEPAEPLIMTRAPVATLTDALSLKDGWVAVESPHFKILSTLEGTTAKYKDGRFVRFDLERLQTIDPKVVLGREGAKLNPEQRAQLYAVRAERVLAHFRALTACEAPYLGMPEKYQIYLFQEYAAHHTYVDRFIGGKQDKAAVQWHFHEQPNFIAVSTAADIVEQRIGRGDGAMSNHFVHNLAHNLIDGHNNYYRETWAWLEEGLAHYYERREAIKWNNFCWAEGESPREFTKPKWETTIFTLVRRERDIPLQQWCEKLQPGELSGVENGMSWGLVKWLVETEPVRFTKMISELDDIELDKTCAECIQDAFGVSVSVLYQRWRDYVLEHYK